MKKILLRFFGLIVILCLAFLWIMLNPKPAFAHLIWVKILSCPLPLTFMMG